MRDPVYTAELNQDRGELTDKMILNALDDIVYRLFDGQSIPRFGDLREFLMQQYDVGELAYQMVMAGGARTCWIVKAELEARLRKHLEGTELLIDYASDLANEEE